jgi:hypothetical protein
VGKIVQSLQSLNYQDSRAHSHERHGPFTRLVVFDRSIRFESSCFSLWYAAGAKPVSIVLGLAIARMPMGYVSLATGGMHVSVGQFGYRYDSFEFVPLGYSWITLVQFMLTSYLGLGVFSVNKPFG